MKKSVNESKTAPGGALLREPFLRVPPFPGSRIRNFDGERTATADFAGLAAEIRRLRVGGSYWGDQPKVPKGAIVMTSREGLDGVERLDRVAPRVLWMAKSETGEDEGVMPISDICDPWHVLEGASALIADDRDERHLIAALLGVPSYIIDRSSGGLMEQAKSLFELMTETGSSAAFDNPFTGQPMAPIEVVRLCGFWRQLIDSNRDIAGGAGFAFWKRAHVEPLLWNGSKPFAFVPTIRGDSAGGSVAVWRSKAPAEVIDALKQKGAALIEVEDGFLRSRGLGADCVPPLSITVDRLAPYFDPSRPSELEELLQKGQFGPELLKRASALRSVIVEAGLGKYGREIEFIDRPAGTRRHILVPGQVEDDRAVQTGGCGLVSNLELLRRVRAEAPDAFIIYKPHPDVLAGHRQGMVSDRACLQWADQVVSERSIASLIAMVDEVHVNTSLAGFEALLRGKGVTTYGVPFYAGWGLTHDLGPVPERRTARRSLDELVAATLLLYPRYLDPVTRLPCPAEVVVARLSQSDGEDPSLIVAMRRVQGRLMRRLRSLVQ